MRLTCGTQELAILGSLHFGVREHGRPGHELVGIQCHNGESVSFQFMLPTKKTIISIVFLDDRCAFSFSPLHKPRETMFTLQMPLGYRGAVLSKGSTNLGSLSGNPSRFSVKPFHSAPPPGVHPTPRRSAGGIITSVSEVVSVTPQSFAIFEPDMLKTVEAPDSDLPGLVAADSELELVDENSQPVTGLRGPARLFGFHWSKSMTVEKRPSGAIAVNGPAVTALRAKDVVHLYFWENIERSGAPWLALRLRENAMNVLEMFNHSLFRLGELRIASDGALLAFGSNNVIQPLY